jgi:glycosyltransferase involved in cell wall biosynthesis
VIKDKGKGANWARNEGFLQVKTEYVLFSDNDIKWREGAISSLLEALEEHPEASYSYGSYLMGGKLYCNQSFDPDVLKSHNYISTMSLIRASDFPGFDETVKRFQDWDLWLTMLERGKIGVHCGEIIFDTEIREGLTFNSDDPVKMAQIIKDKHNI